MISSIEITCNAAHPEMPLTPFVAFKTSPSSVRVMGVPKRIGNWVIDSVFLKVLYPDNSYSTKTCLRNGNVWVGTLDGTDTTGIVENGFTIGADGVDENGEAVTGYILGVGDVRILDADGSYHPDVQSHVVRILEGMPENPNVGDAYFEDGALMIMTNGGWRKTLLKVSQLLNDSNYWANGRNLLYVEDDERGTTQIIGNAIYVNGGMMPASLNVSGYEATVSVHDDQGNGVEVKPSGIRINSSPVATYSYIDSNVKTMIGGYLRPRDYTAFQTYAQLVETTNQAKQHPTYQYFWDGDGYKNPNHNDHVLVDADETHDNRTTVYRWVGNFPGAGGVGRGWQYLYTVNGDKLTTSQKAVLDGGPYAKTGDVKNSTITITQGGVNKGSFTLNQGSDKTIALDAGGGGSSKCLVHVDHIGSTYQHVTFVSGGKNVKVARGNNGGLDIYIDNSWVNTAYEYTGVVMAADKDVTLHDDGYPSESCAIMDGVKVTTSGTIDTTGKSAMTILLEECLEQTTPITMADGTTKPVCELKIGDKVLSLNPDTLQLEEDDVGDCDGGIMKMHNRMDVWNFADGTTIKTIKPHQFFNVRTGQMEYMADFMIGDGVRKQDGTTTTLTGHETKYGVYFHNTLYTRKYNNYFANGILTGNRKSVKWGWLWKQENA